MSLSSQGQPLTNKKSIIMLKKILNLQGVEELSKTQKESVKGSLRLELKPSCYGGDSICCGTANWQCGTGPSAGGTFGGYFNGTPICNCY